MKLKNKMAALLLPCLLWAPGQALAVGTWTALTHQAPGNVIQIFLLSDGTVMAQDNDTGTPAWYKLTPDSSGHYVSGTWSTRQNSSYVHYYGSSVVLQNGDVFVAGGEYGSGSDYPEIYDPVANSWSVGPVAPFGGIADGNGVLLNNGLVLLEPQGTTHGDNGTIWTYNPANNTWAQTGTSLKGIGESTWVKLPNDDILIIDSDNSGTGGTTAEYYSPSLSAWLNAQTSGTIPSTWANLTLAGEVGETGPALLLPNSNAMFFGGNGLTAIYNNGAWSQGPTIPNGQVAADAPGAMMPNGKILLEVGPPLNDSTNNTWSDLSYFYEFDYTANGGAGGYAQTTAPGGGSSRSEVMYVGRMVDLPDGTILWSDGHSQLYVYTPDGTPLSSGQPTIESVSKNSDGSLHLVGTLFNGISQGASYGDDAQMDSNYPLVRFTDAGGHVRYGRSYNWSSTSVMTGSALLSTECTLPAGASLQDTIQVVANGNASAGVHYPLFGGVTRWVDYSFSDPGNIYDGSQALPFNTIHSAFFTGLLGTGLDTVKPGEILNIAGNHYTSGGDGIITITTPVRITAWPGTGTAHIGPN